MLRYTVYITIEERQLTLKDKTMYENEIEKISEIEIREAVKSEIENIIDNMQYDDEIEMPEFNEIEIFCECNECQRKSMNPEQWRYMQVINGIVVSSECYDRISKKMEFENLVESVEELLEELEYDYDYSIANTGTYYFTAEKDEKEIKIRVADHSECYCNEDHSVDLAGGMTIEQLRKAIS